MTRWLPACTIALALSACVTLPGSDSPSTARYLLRDANSDCRSPAEPLALSVVRAGAGLDTDRIARRDSESGEVTYLAGVRWADQLPGLLEQQMARDLECGGYAIMTGHHRTMAQSRLVCELRAFNLVANGGNRAEAWLSCMYYPRGAQARAVVSRHSAALADWSADSAVAALNAAYGEVIEDIQLGLADAGPQ